GGEGQDLDGQAVALQARGRGNDARGPGPREAVQGNQRGDHEGADRQVPGQALPVLSTRHGDTLSERRDRTDPTSEYGAKRWLTLSVLTTVEHRRSPVLSRAARQPMLPGTLSPARLARR